MARFFTPQAFLCNLIFCVLSTSSQFAKSQLSPLSSDDLEALREIRNKLSDIPGSNFFSTWNFSSPDPCSSFEGILCTMNNNGNDGLQSTLQRISFLALGNSIGNSPGLFGTLSPYITNLTALTQLIVYPGKISGSLPVDLGCLKLLQFVSITNNLITGPIPLSVTNLSNLHTLDLGSNRLNGTISPDLTSLPELEVLILGSNDLYGEVPDIRSMLLHLDLSRNSLSGKLPSVLPSSLRYFSATGNSLSGSLDTLSFLENLEFLDLSANNFSGEIPKNLFGPNPSALLLQRNNLTGGIPDAYAGDGEKGPDSTVDLSHNNLSGELTPILAGTESLFLNNNHFGGTVPPEYVKSVYSGSMKTLQLQHNYFSSIPIPHGTALPDASSLCVSYNCMVSPVDTSSCPADNLGALRPRPESQCAVFNSSIIADGNRN